MKKMSPKFSVVISGSFRKHFEGIKKTIQEFEACGIEVLSPKPSAVINPEEEFVILETDESSDPKNLEEQHLEAIKKADTLYIYNPGGYIGASATLELGFAYAFRKTIFSKESCRDFTLKLFVNAVATPEQVKTILSLQAEI